MKKSKRVLYGHTSKRRRLVPVRSYQVRFEQGGGARVSQAPVAIHAIIILFILLRCFPQTMCLVTLHKQRITLSLPLIVIGHSAYSHHLTSNQHTPRHTNVTQTCLIYAKKWYWIIATSSWIMNKIMIKTQ